MMAAKLKTAVLGATGYSGLELTRILLRHPRLEKPVRSEAVPSLETLHRGDKWLLVNTPRLHLRG